MIFTSASQSKLQHGQDADHRTQDGHELDGDDRGQLRAFGVDVIFEDDFHPGHRVVEGDCHQQDRQRRRKRLLQPGLDRRVFGAGQARHREDEPQGQRQSAVLKTVPAVTYAASSFCVDEGSLTLIGVIAITILGDQRRRSIHFTDRDQWNPTALTGDQFGFASSGRLAPVDVGRDIRSFPFNGIRLARQKAATMPASVWPKSKSPIDVDSVLITRTIVLNLRTMCNYVLNL